jgi:alpha-1,3-rhamnosyl/mannosyltransferase
MPNKTIVTIHDLIPLDGEDKFSSSEVKYFKKCVERACCKATLLFTPSNYVRKRLIDEFKADPERVFVNYWAPDSKIKKLEEDEYRTTTEKYDLQRPYCLHFGARAPRKNTETTLIAWSQLDPVKRSAWNLLVVGLDGETLQKLKKMSQDLGIESEVRLHGFVPEVHISPLMSGADVLIFASLSEGFGLPILDAWATDTAVLTGDKTSLPEIAGNAALIVDPRMPESIATGMDKLMNDSLLRHRLCALGRERLSEFTWEKSAARFINAIEESKGLKL